MKALTIAQREEQAIRIYLALGDAMRAALLPNWVVADLTMSQVKALMLLGYYGSLSVSELAGLLKMGKPAASILVQQLVDQALVERSEDAKDRRRTLVQITSQGDALIRGRFKQTETKLREWLSRLSEAELDRVLEGLNALAKAAQLEPK